MDPSTQEKDSLQFGDGYARFRAGIGSSSHKAEGRLEDYCKGLVLAQLKSKNFVCVCGMSSRASIACVTAEKGLVIDI
jgi:hypothetical protein